MKFEQTDIDGVLIIKPQLHKDERGYFTRIFCQESLQKNGLHHRFLQEGISHNIHKGTIRGMHFQKSPFEEVKIVTCIAGAICDAVIDLREQSKTFGQSFKVELSAENRAMLYIDKGIAHGFQTLKDHTDVHYHLSAPYEANAASGVRWDDPQFNLTWPLPISVINERDANWPNFAL